MVGKVASHTVPLDECAELAVELVCKVLDALLEFLVILGAEHLEDTQGCLVLLPAERTFLRVLLELVEVVDEFAYAPERNPGATRQPAPYLSHRPPPHIALEAAVNILCATVCMGVGELMHVFMAASWLVVLQGACIAETQNPPVLFSQRVSILRVVRLR